MDLVSRTYRKLFDIILATRGMTPTEESGPFTNEHGGVGLWRFNEAAPGTHVCFTSRLDGVSKPPYDSLNLGYHVGDDPADVTVNRELLASYLGVDSERLTSPRQRHTAEVRIVTEADAGRGATSETSHFGDCDGLLTTLPGTPLLLHFADCVPVVLTGTSSEGKPAIAVLHAGRVGLFAGVIAAGVAAMRDDLGVDPGGIIAAVGPAIGACCYEVDEETGRGFEERFGAGVFRFDTSGRNLLDLHSAARKALVEAGVASRNIHVLELCTSCNSSLFSYRRDGVTGRHGAIAWIS